MISSYFYNDAYKVLACALSIPTLGSRTLHSLGDEFLTKTRICPSTFLPSGTTAFFDKYFDYPKIFYENWPFYLNPRDYLFHTPKSRIIHWIVGPIVEEILDRVILQEFLLKRIPERILQQIHPRYSHLVHHPATRIARIFASSLYFALHHSWAHTCDEGDMYPYLLAGAIFGTLQEISGHPLYNIISHIAANKLTYS